MRIIFINKVHNIAASSSRVGKREGKESGRIGEKRRRRPFASPLRGGLA